MSMKDITKDWISVKDKLPKGMWTKFYPYLSEEVLVANSCAIAIAYYDRTDGIWYTGVPLNKEWIDKITYWKPLPENPNETNAC